MKNITDYLITEQSNNDAPAKKIAQKIEKLTKLKLKFVYVETPEEYGVEDTSYIYSIENAIIDDLPASIGICVEKQYMTFNVDSVFITIDKNGNIDNTNDEYAEDDMLIDLTDDNIIKYYTLKNVKHAIKQYISEDY